MTSYGWTEAEAEALVRRLADRRRQSEPAPIPAAPPPLGGWGSEDELQIACIRWLRSALAPPARCWHVENEGKRSGRKGGKAVGKGLLAGIPDIQIVALRTTRWVNGSEITTAANHWIELKLPGATLSTAQREWRDWCRATGQPWSLCRSLTEAQEQCGEWGLTRTEEATR